MISEKQAQVLVVGGGPAGLAAAIAAKENGAGNTVVLEREPDAGGILRQCIHNGFGLHRFSQEMTGPEYAARDIEKARQMGIPVLTETTVLSIMKDRIVTSANPERGMEKFRADAIVLAMGCRERPRGALGIPGTRCSGIYSAGTAQKYVNLMGLMPGKRVVILGSGDIGLIMARRMTLQGAKVLACLEIMPYSGGLNRNIVQCLNDFHIPLYLSHTVVDIRGRERLSGVTAARVDSLRRPIPGTEIDFDCDTLLLSVGLLPENELTRKCGIPLTGATGGAVVNDCLETEVPGIFACGNVLHVHDLVDNVSEESARAGKAAAEYALGEKHGGCETILVSDGFGVRGTVPQRIRSDRKAQDKVRLMFRTTEVFRDASVKISCGGETVLQKKMRIMTPGEMVSLTVDPAVLDKIRPGSELTVSVDV